MGRPLGRVQTGRRLLCLLLLAASMMSAQAGYRLVSPLNMTGNGRVRMGRRLQQLPTPASAQVFLDGYIEAATLDAACVTAHGATGPKNCGGTVTVNGILVTVPKNLIVMLPANALTWEELFQPEWGGTGTATNLALGDAGKVPGATYHISVQANRVGTRVIAALLDVSMDPLVAGAGYIDAIDYTTGEITVESAAGASKLRINDPTGRYGQIHAGPPYDPRFCVDPDNPTIAAGTGFPMCVPRTVDANKLSTDAECPEFNRPVDGAGNPQTIFTMNTPGNHPDPTKMVPLKVGDYIIFSGVKTTASFMAVYSISANLGIFTQPGIDPAYVIFEDVVYGTGGLNTLGVGEAAIRSVFGGFTTDPSRPVQLYAMDFNPTDGKPTQRDLGQVKPDPGPPTGAFKGRWRIRPPCTEVAPLTPASQWLGTNKGCTPPPAGVYTPPPREVQIFIMGCNPALNPDGSPQTNADGSFKVANGIASGACSYRNPAIEYLWPESVPGTPIVENNFQALNFLAQGGYTSAGQTLVGTLDPWPSNVLPQNSCLPPTITVGGPYSVSTGGMVTVDSTTTGPGGPFSLQWTVDNPSLGGTCSNPTQSTTVCGPVGGSTTYTLTATNTCGMKFTAQATVTAVTTPKQVIQSIAPQSLVSGKVGASITASLSSSTSPTTFTWTPPSGVTIKTTTPIATTSTSSSVITFDCPMVPQNSITATQLAFTVTAGSGMSTSDPVTALVNVLPQPDVVSITAVAFRCDKHRMTVTATTSINNPQLILKLAPYTDNSGKLYDPSSIVNPVLVYGLVGAVPTYTITIEPVPVPSMSIASLTVTSAIGGSDSHKIVTSDIKGVNGVICTI